MKLSKQTKVLVVDEAEVELEEEVEAVVARPEPEPEVAPGHAAEVQFSSSREELGAGPGAEDLEEDLLEEEEEQEEEVEQLPGEQDPGPDQLADGSTTGSRVQEGDLVSA